MSAILGGIRRVRASGGVQILRSRARSISTAGSCHWAAASGSGAGSNSLPEQAQVVVCGGGIVGCSVAYHLPKVGCKDVVLLEQGSIGCGTTWHAASLVGQLRGSLPETKICKYGVELYQKLEEETGLGTSWKQTGSITLARNKDRLTAARRVQAIGRVCGIDTEVISPEECRKLCPLIRTDDLLAALWIPTDGVALSSDITNSLAKGATLQGVRVMEKVGVEGVDVENGRVCGVRTSQGDIKCEVFINCAGQWARQLGQLSNPPVNIPLHSSEHFYIVTKPMDVDPMMPVVRDHCGYIYVREWSGGFLAGGFEPRGKPCFAEGIPESFEFQLLPEDWDHFQILLEQILHRVPAMENAEIRQMINGPESFTPDLHPMVGETAEIRNYYVAAGLNSYGIAGGAGFGKALAEWVAGGGPPYDLWTVDVRRFGPHHSNKKYLFERTREAMGRHYQLPYPKWELVTGRGMRRSPLHDRLDAARASWGCVMGWERPNWFAKENESCDNDLTFGQPNWLANSGEEHLACREGVALFDLTSFAKFEIEGSDAESALQMLCSNNLAVPPGKIVYTGMLNQHGGFQTDCTVTRLTRDKYLAVCPAGQATYMAAWISRHLPSSVSLRDVTAGYSVLALMGPKSRDVLQKITGTPLDNERFPFSTLQTIEVGLASGVRAMRITYVGELGWELHVPSEFALGVYEQLMEEGAELGLRNGGMYAVDSLRMEKGFRHWGHELDTHTTPWEAQLGFIVDMEKGDFIGRSALAKQKEEGVHQMITNFTVDTKDDENLLPWGHENIYRNGELVGYVTSASFGHSVGKPLCMGLIYGPKDSRAITTGYLREGRYEIEIDGNSCPAQMSLRPFYDPKSLRVRM